MASMSLSVVLPYVRPRGKGQKQHLARIQRAKKKSEIKQSAPLQTILFQVRGVTPLILGFLQASDLCVWTTINRSTKIYLSDLPQTRSLWGNLLEHAKTQVSPQKTALFYSQTCYEKNVHKIYRNGASHIYRGYPLKIFLSFKEIIDHACCVEKSISEKKNNFFVSRKQIISRFLESMRPYSISFPEDQRFSMETTNQTIDQALQKFPAPISDWDDYRSNSVLRDYLIDYRFNLGLRDCVII